ncbi:MAG: 3-methyl-2-oxobutanoate hydroxymethyltransferase [Dehalococcoidia bacterium]
MSRLPITELAGMKERGEKIPMLTAYDYPTARIIDAAGVPIVLVGDSLGMVVLGYDSTLPVTLDDMIHHAKAVVRGSQRAIVVVDMPFMSFQVSREEALRNAGRLIKETGATAVKLEGGEAVSATVNAIVDAGIPVMGHLGLTPQSVNQLGGYRLQGKTPAAVVKLINDAVALERAGAFAIVLETVPANVARLVTNKLRVPTIGIGAGPFCDGQVQVLHDFLGLYSDFLPRHARRFVELAPIIDGAVRSYMELVQSGKFPSAKESFGLDKAKRAIEGTAELAPYGSATPAAVGTE